jgi:hypothetical protein
MKKIEEKIKKLPPELQQEVLDFINFLLQKKIKKKKKKLKLKWIGALKDLRDKYNSVSLQHKISEWWGD